MIVIDIVSILFGCHFTAETQIMSAPLAPAKRAYLNRDDRRAQLLECAATIVDREGWSALTMVSLAKEAKGSRQLVYQHFSSVTELVRDTGDYLFQELRERITLVFSDSGMTLRESAEQAARITFEFPPGRAAALLQLMVVPFDEGNELSAVSRRIRKASTAVAREMLAAKLPDWPENARHTLAATMDMAIWSLHLSVSDGITDKESAIRTFAWSLDALVRSGQQEIA